jgi:rhamnogalacturonan endolyase
MYRYDIGFNNSTKSNPGLVADIVGDWREEVIVPSSDHLTDLKVFSTWYPTEHKFPWLMTDHTYYMSVLNQNVGYNQPTNLGYYLGSDLTSDSEAWEQGGYIATDIRELPATTQAREGQGQQLYNLQGQRVSETAKGLLIMGGKKVFRK